MTILEKLAEYAEQRVQAAKKNVSSEDIRALALSMPKGDFEFEKALRKPNLSFICECKKASPSKGLIVPIFPYLQIAKEFEEAGADCISVLTEPRMFLGQNEYLRRISLTVGIPCLRKDFVVDEYMIYEAKILGASAVLLICSLLDEAKLKEYLGICRELGMSALVEVHDEKEAECAVNAGAGIIGVNNRNLNDFSIDTDNGKRLKKMIPKKTLFVSESGVKTADDIKKVRSMGADAVLIGEAMMRAADKQAKLKELREA